MTTEPIDTSTHGFAAPGLATDTLAMIRDQASRLLAKAATPEHLKALLDQTAGFDRPLWTTVAEQGWPAIAIPEAAGGLGLDWRGLSVLMEEVGRTTLSLPLVGNAVAASALLAAYADNADAIGQQVGALADGSRIACLAFAEAGEGGLRLEPETLWSGERLTGAKALTPFAAVADLALVQASNDTGDLVLVLVPLDQDGVTRRTAPSLDNARAAAAVDFAGAAGIPLPLADARREFERLTALAALATAFEQVGGAQACLDMARGYALERRAFGQPIGKFQAIKHKLADMYWRLEIARGSAIDALEALEQNDPLWIGMVAAARVGAIDAHAVGARENIQTHGGLGVTWEAMPHHHYRRARSLASEIGNAIHWRERLLAEFGFDVDSQ